MTPTLNSALLGFTCPRCRREFEVDDFLSGCPACAEGGFPVNPYARYDSEAVASLTSDHGATLPLRGYDSLGEGDTPILALDSLRDELGIARLWLKHEGANPNGSHKDRMSVMVAARARQLGKTHLLAASSGNAGVSVAAYAARAGLACTIIAPVATTGTWKQAMLDFGATVITHKDLAYRWQMTAEMVRDKGMYPATNLTDPPVGSNPFGIQGYKTVAHDIARELGEDAPTMVLVPTCRGDLLWGIGEGFKEAVGAGLMERVPRLVAVEPFARLSKVLAGEDYRKYFEGDTDQHSIGGGTATAQSVTALRDSNGMAVEADDEDARAAQKRFLALGISLERCSAATLAALYTLKQMGNLASSERVLLMGTSHGLFEDS